mmetsp:Transcript_2411/g.9075  ORF Transcript_2411/g.9075 Transcript_2411/m.9075 type:complete len:224 (+) Transcript_2411:3032-3703(+)
MRMRRYGHGARRTCVTRGCIGSGWSQTPLAAVPWIFLSAAGLSGRASRGSRNIKVNETGLIIVAAKLQRRSNKGWIWLDALCANSQISRREILVHVRVPNDISVIHVDGLHSLKHLSEFVLCSHLHVEQPSSSERVCSKWIPREELFHKLPLLKLNWFIIDGFELCSSAHETHESVMRMFCNWVSNQINCLEFRLMLHCIKGRNAVICSMNKFEIWLHSKILE